MLISYKWNYLREKDANLFYNGKQTLFLRLPLREIQNSRPVGVWKKVHCNPHLYKVNWLLESISSARISLLPEPYKYHFIMPANKPAIPNITNRIIIFELSLLIRALSMSHWGVMSFWGGALHLRIQVKHSVSFVLQLKSRSRPAELVIHWERQDEVVGKQKFKESFTCQPLLNHLHLLHLCTKVKRRRSGYYSEGS